MAGQDIHIDFPALVKATDDDKPLIIHGEWMHLTFKNLVPGEFYVVPLYFWADRDRPLRVEILKPGTPGEILKEYEFIIGRQNRRNGKDTWLSKRYKLDKQRHDGTARMRIGWPFNHHAISAKDIPFQVIGTQLTSKALEIKRRIANGHCPHCNKPGQWQAMAMVCKEHGAFLGA